MVPFGVAFVTGSTGLLGSNLVRELVSRGVKVRALARSPDKARKQFADLAGVEVIQGDMLQVEAFTSALSDVDVLFHTAAHFRDSYTGGNHWAELKSTNVDGTRDLLKAAYHAGVRRAVLTSSIAVLNGKRGTLINESMLRELADADDYYRSKIMGDEVASDLMQTHPDLDVCFVLPGWMHGPGDAGPTSAGQVTLDYLAQKLPGVAPATFSFVDARDVALAEIAAAERGRRGERYLAAGCHTTMGDLLKDYEAVSGVPAPNRKIPGALLLIIATVSEVIARVTRKPILLSLATVKLMLKEADRTRFDHTKSQRELNVTFRPITETLRDEIEWFRSHGWLGHVATAA